jgi:hypothetical protein
MEGRHLGDKSIRQGGRKHAHPLKVTRQLVQGRDPRRVHTVSGPPSRGNPSSTARTHSLQRHHTFRDGAPAGVTIDTLPGDVKPPPCSCS